MKIRYVLLLTLIVSCSICIPTYAKDMGLVFFYEMDETEELRAYVDVYGFGSLFSQQEKAMLMIMNLLEGPKNERVFHLIPKGTELLGISWRDNHLRINLSAQIKNYGGATWEIILVRQLLDTVFALKEVESVTLYINGKVDYLPEGTIIDQYTKEQWIQERMDSLCSE